MSKGRTSLGKVGKGRAFAIAGALALCVPSASFAIGTLGSAHDDAASPKAIASLGYPAFTPAGVDLAYAKQVAQAISGKGLRFTPADTTGRAERDMTVAVRVNPQVARAISVRRASKSAFDAQSRGTLPGVASVPVRYDLGLARGYQSFAQSVPKIVSLGKDVQDVPMADLSDYRREVRDSDDKPRRFSSRIAIDSPSDVAPGALRPVDSLGDQTVDVSGSYRVLKNLDVTAGVRMTQDRDRLAPLTDTAQDAQAVYVGTQFKF